MLYLYSLTDFKWPQSFLLNAFGQAKDECRFEWWRKSDEWALNYKKNRWFDFELFGSFGELPQIKIRIVNGKIMWCRKVGELAHDTGCRVLTTEEWGGFLTLKDSLDSLKLPNNYVEENGFYTEYDGCLVIFTEGANGNTFPQRQIWHGYEPMKLFIRAVELSGLHIHWWEEWHWK